jgi:hypothetical protein
MIKLIVDTNPTKLATSLLRNGPNFTNGPKKKYPCAKPTLIPRNNGDNPAL